MNRNNLSTFNFEVYDLIYLSKRLALLGLPLALALTFILVIDPYNFWGYSRLIPNETKEPIALLFNPPFWKLNKFEREPAENILLGDSRMIAMNTGLIREITGEDYANLAYGGGNVREAIETFWLAAEKTTLRKVYLSINLDKYNDYEITDRTVFYKSTGKNPFLYFLNYDVWTAAYHNADVHFNRKNFQLGKPNVSKDEFWREGVEVETRYYQKYAEPKKYRDELTKISAYCRARNIELTFVIFPTHLDLQRVVDQTNMRGQREAMVRDLRDWGRVYDFDWENEMTANKDNFTDPFHFTEEIAAVLIREIWGGNTGLARLYPQNK
jgi:hypothetical protein